MRKLGIMTVAAVLTAVSVLPGVAETAPWRTAPNGWKYQITFLPGGRLTVNNVGPKGEHISDTGTWWMQDGKRCHKFDHVSSGTFCH